MVNERVSEKRMNVFPMSKQEARRTPPLILAYVGDAVYEVYIRSLLARRAGNVRKLHALCVRWVSAVGQEKVWYAIQDYLTDEEAAIARQGRNAKGNVPHNVDPATYRRSTSLEAVIGYLYLSGQQERLNGLLGQTLRDVDPEIFGEAKGDVMCPSS